MSWFTSLLGFGGSSEEKPEKPPGATEADVGEQIDLSSDDISQVDEDRREAASSLWSFRSGMDIMNLRLPIGYFEPTTILVRQAEACESVHLLDQAAFIRDPMNRLLNVVAFLVSTYSSTERVGKPMDPFLGETFEFRNFRPVPREGVAPTAEFLSNTRFLAEQVSIDPPISASVCYSPNFVFRQDSRVRTRFWGNKVDIHIEGKNVVLFPALDEAYTFSVPVDVVHNVLVGSLWIDHAGDLAVQRVVNWSKPDRSVAETALVTFKACGWFNSNRYVVEGLLKDAAGTARIGVLGKWNESLNSVPLGPDGQPCGMLQEVWHVSSARAAAYEDNIHRMGQFVRELIAFNPDARTGDELIPPSDSRWRADRRAFERRDNHNASLERAKLYDAQAQLVQSGAHPGPRFFVRGTDEQGTDTWLFRGGYWEARSAVPLVTCPDPLVAARAAAATTPSSSTTTTTTTS
eukprot:gnl/Spiro4/6593_TR3394_c0_g1_i1.p1 gnl/Spiro4/6593_TR3394_c0_g1~~gnl/Spiro4/6593_TR3394_c0_g1_i1.p1  ORF type:complete len:462 (-),score=68.55 gnl/Spiro4/6593_TR3394_c0_g1_i1:205-1590(-)